MRIYLVEESLHDAISLMKLSLHLPDQKLLGVQEAQSLNIPELLIRIDKFTAGR